MRLLRCSRSAGIAIPCCKRTKKRERVRTKTTERGYGVECHQLARGVIKAHPWCADCGTDNLKIGPAGVRSDPSQR
jgi:hypothetical protein